jgi:hypothetical protein
MAFMQDGVEGFCYIHLKHHPIMMDIQNGFITMNHCLTTTPNRHAKLM